MEQVEEELTFLLRSENRRDVLTALKQHRSLDRHEIVERADASRRTVSRVLKTLDEEGYIRNSNSSYRLTAYGGSMIDLYQQWKERTTLTERYQPFLATVDEDAFDCPLRYLRGASLTVATDFTPHAPVNRLVELRQRATRIRSVTPFVEKRCLTHLTEWLQRGREFDAEVVVSKEVVENALEQSRYESMLETIRGADATSIFVHPGPLQMVCSVVDRVTVLGAYVDRNLHTLVESDGSELREWTTDRIDAYRRDATPLEEYPS